MDQRVAVVGMGVALPRASDPEELWTLLEQDETVFGEPGDRFRLDSFYSPDPNAEDRGHTRTGGFLTGLRPHPRLAAELAAGRFAAEEEATVWLRHCVLQACDGVQIRDADRAAVHIGAFPDGIKQVEEAAVIESVAAGVAEQRARRGTALSAAREALLRARLRQHYRHQSVSGRALLPDRVAQAAVAGILPVIADFTVVDAACASGVYAIDLGVKSLRDGSAAIALCGGVFVLGPRYLVGFAKVNGITRRGQVRVFDESADGTLFSDGAAVVALKRLADAITAGDPVLGVITGVGLSADGRGKAIYAPRAQGQRLCLQRARTAAGVTAADVDWVIAHGTGTRAGDDVELEVLSDAAPPAGLPVTSNKSLVGHTGWASGVVSTIHALLALRHGRIPAQRHLDEPSGRLRTQDLVTVPTNPLDWPRSPGRSRTVGVTAAGFGGANGHLVIQDAPAGTPSGAPEPADPVMLLAWAAHLPGDPDPDTIVRTLLSASPSTTRTFGPDYPELTFAESRLPPPSARALDRSQRMALRVAARFAADHGELWARMPDSTGVVAAHMGPTRTMLDNLVRCYGDDLLGIDQLPDDLAAALGEVIRTTRATVPPTTADTLPGSMPNIIAARLANRYDLHGPAFSVDTGRTSGLAALHTACRYLRSRDMDLALVLGVNADGGPDRATLVDVPPERIREGAFLVALSRRSTADAHGWRTLATVTTNQSECDVGDITALCGDSERPTYLGADGVAAAIRALHNGAARTAIIPAGGQLGPTITVAPATVAAGNKCATQRFVQSVRATSRPRQAGARVPLLPHGGLVLAGTHALGNALDTTARAAGATLVVADRQHEHGFLAAGAADRMRGWPGLPPTAHVTVVASLQDTRWPAPPARELLALQELAFLAAAEHRDLLDAGGSFRVLVLDPFAGDVGHPHGSLLTGLARSLRWELPGCRVLALTTDTASVDAGLRQLAAETTDDDPPPGTRVRAGAREAEVFHPLPEAVDDACPLAALPDVVVAAGGARGITAAVLLGLARRHRPRIWLLGSTDLAAHATTGADSLAAELSAEPGLSVRAATQRLRAHRRAQETRATLDALRTVCGPSRVTYLTCDVTDQTAVENAARSVYAAEGAVDLLIHAAGVGRSAGLGAKTLADFRAVRDTKLLGYHHLKHAFADPPPRRWCNFGSILGVLGYPGETDYAPANEFLAMAALREQRAHGAEEQTLAWGLWAETGMAASPIQQTHADSFGVLTAMSTAEGVAHFLDELAHPAAGRPVVLRFGDREIRALDGRIQEVAGQ